MSKRLIDNGMICLSELKSRGWTDSLINQYLPDPVLMPNPYYDSDKNIRLWYLDEVEMIEQTTDAFINSQNNKSKKQEEKRQRKERARKKYEEKIAKFAEELNVYNPAADYPNARKLYRHFILNVGPTNTGKTYRALQALKAAESGVYLAPLRLLAMEVQDKLLDDGVLCSMTTGEEENIIEDATIMSSTVEKINLNATYEVGVIDECQMIADDARGGSWTRAILGLAAKTIYLCMSPDAVEICIKLIDMCDDTYEIVECTRNTDLIFQGTIGLSEIKKNDAVILFSRKKVLQFAEDIKRNLGLNPSVVYGALPYKARKQQVELYNSGKTDIIVATDAIGMGMNLPIQRVVFAEDEKFDGICTRYLSSSEIKQIAGRAGRQGIFDEGYVVGLLGTEMIKERLDGQYSTITKAHVPFPEEALRHSDEKLSTILQNWAQIKYPDIFRQQNIIPVLERVLYLEQSYADLTKYEMLKLATVMFDEKDEELLRLWKKYVGFYVQKEVIWMPKVQNGCKSLHINEHIHKELDLFYSFHKTMDLEFNYNEIVKRKEQLIALINECLIETNKKVHKQINKSRKNKKHKKYHNFDNDEEWNSYLDELTCI